MKFFREGLAILGLSACAAVATTSNEANGLDFVYPYTVRWYRFESQRQHLSMAYMDIPANTTSKPKGIITLLHGKNFCGATWNQTIQVLSNDGYRVIVPDQIGFCKSTKPSGYQFTLQQLALNTNQLLNSLSITNATIIGHSMGGMISARYALMFPSQTTRLVMVDPLGLENWFSLGVPYQTVNTTFGTELATTYDSLKSYQQATYYSGTWKPAYDVWVNMLLSIYQGSQGERFAFLMALTTDMVFTQPIIYELPNLKMKSALIVGDKDNTAIGKAWAPASVKPLLGHYDILNCTLIEFADLGHSPQIQDPDAFHSALLAWLA